MLKALFGLLSLVIIVGVLGAAVWFFVSRNQTLTKAQQTAGHAVVAEHQAQAAQQAQAIVVRGGARDHVDVVLHQENAHAIEAAPGASAPLGAGFVTVFNRRVCQHPAESTDCGQPPVRPADPAQLPDADPGAATPPS